MCSEIDDIISSIDVNSVKSDFNQKHFVLLDEDFTILEGVQLALRKTLLQYKLHKEQDLFDKAFDYIREHY
jgi:hypothetical protein